MTCIEPAGVDVTIATAWPSLSVHASLQCSADQLGCAPVGTVCVLGCMNETAAAGQCQQPASASQSDPWSLLVTGPAAMMCDGDGQWRPAQPVAPESAYGGVLDVRIPTHSLGSLDSVLVGQAHVAPWQNTLYAVWQLDCGASSTWEMPPAGAATVGVSSDCNVTTCCRLVLPSEWIAPVCAVAFPPPPPSVAPASRFTSTAGGLVTVPTASSPPMPWWSAVASIAPDAWSTSSIAAWQAKLREQVGASPGGPVAASLHLDVTLAPWQWSNLTTVETSHCQAGQPCTVTLVSRMVTTIAPHVWTTYDFTPVTLDMSAAYQALSAAVVELATSDDPQLQLLAASNSLMSAISTSGALIIAMTAGGLASSVGGSATDAASAATSGVSMPIAPSDLASLIQARQGWATVVAAAALPIAPAAPSVEIASPDPAMSPVPVRLLVSRMLPAASFTIRFPVSPAVGETLAVSCAAATPTAAARTFGSLKLAVDRALLDHGTWSHLASGGALPGVHVQVELDAETAMPGSAVSATTRVRCTATSTLTGGIAAVYNATAAVEVPVMLLRSSTLRFRDIVVETATGGLRSVYSSEALSVAAVVGVPRGTRLGDLPQALAERLVRMVSAAAAPTAQAAAGSPLPLTVTGSANMTLVAAEDGGFPPHTTVWIGDQPALVQWRSPDGDLLRFTAPPLSAMCTAAGCRPATLTLTTMDGLSVAHLAVLASGSAEFSRVDSLLAARTLRHLPSSTSCNPFCPGVFDVGILPLPSLVLTPRDRASRAPLMPLLTYAAACDDAAFPDPMGGVCANTSHPLAAHCGVGAGAACRPCSDLSPGAVCPGGTRLWPRPGYWSSPSQDGVIRCRDPTVRCAGWNPARGASVCSTGYSPASAACTRCEPGWYRAMDDSCQACPPSSMGDRARPVITFIGLLLAVVAAIAALAVVTRSWHKRSLAQCVVFALQFTASAWLMMQVSNPSSWH